MASTTLSVVITFKQKQGKCELGPQLLDRDVAVCGLAGSFKPEMGLWSDGLERNSRELLQA